MCAFKTYQHMLKQETVLEWGTWLKSSLRVCCLGSKLAVCCYCSLSRYHRVWWPGDSLSPPLKGMVTQEGDGIHSYQPPSCSSKMFVYHASRRRHARLWRAGTAGIVPGKCREARLSVCRSPGPRLAGISPHFSPKVTE